MQPNSNTGTAKAWMNSHFVLSGRSDFHLSMTCQLQFILYESERLLYFKK